MEARIDNMGMTDRQFDAYQARLIKILKMIAETDSESVKAKLQELITEIEAELKRP